jgi:hypothetical protein
MTVLQPLTTGQLLDRVFTLYRQNFLLFFLIAAVPQAVLMLMMAGGAVVAGAAPIAAVGMVVVGLLLYLGTLGLSQGATTIAVSEVYLGRPITAAEAFRRIAPRTLVLVGTMIGVSLLVGMGLILLIVPGIYFLVTYSLALTVVAIEKVSFSEAMSRSSDLVKGNRGRVAVIYFLSLVATYVIAFALAFPAGMAAAVLQESMPVVSAILQMAGQVVSSALATPIGLIGFTLAYYDARVRKEAFDLHLMMDSATPAQNPAATASV